MAKKQENREKKPLKKVRANFEVVGEVGTLGEWSFNIDTLSSSGFKYSNMKLNIKASEQNSISCEAMGGFFPNRASNTINARTKDGETVEVDWADRTNEAVLKEISSLNKINIALEKDVNNNLVYKEFLSWYDAIEYVQPRISEGMRVKVRGNLSFSEYNDTVTVRKNIQSIYLAGDKDVNHASFAQTMLIMADDLDKSHAKEDKIIDIHARVVDYDRDIRGNRTFAQTFKYEIDTSDTDKLGKILKYFTPKKDIVREITFEGNLVEGANVSTVKKEDIPSELQDLIDLGLYSEEEILNKMAVKGPKSINFFVTKPMVTSAKEGELPKIMLDDEKYIFDDLVIEIPEKEENSQEESPENSDEELDKMLSDLDEDSSSEEKADTEEDPLAWMKMLED